LWLAEGHVTARGVPSHSFEIPDVTMPALWERFSNLPADKQADVLRPAKKDDIAVRIRELDLSFCDLIVYSDFYIHFWRIFGGKPQTCAAFPRISLLWFPFDLVLAQEIVSWSGL
jgi:hypothetical protein